LSFWNISSLFNLKTCRQAPRCQEVCHENITSLDRIALFREQICFWFLYIQKLSKMIILDASQSQESTTNAGEDALEAMNTFIQRLLGVADPAQLKDFSLIFFLLLM